MHIHTHLHTPKCILAWKIAQPFALIINFNVKNQQTKKPKMKFDKVLETLDKGGEGCWYKSLKKLFPFC